MIITQRKIQLSSNFIPSCSNSKPSSTCIWNGSPGLYGLLSRRRYKMITRINRKISPKMDTETPITNDLLLDLLTSKKINKKIINLTRKSSHPEVYNLKKLFWKISQNSQEHLRWRYFLRQVAGLKSSYLQI